MSTLGFYSVSHICSRVDWQHQPVMIDLSSVEVVEPFGLIYLGMFLRHFNSKGISFQIKPSNNQGVREFFAKQRFYERFNFDEKAISEEQLIHIEDSTSFNNIVDIQEGKYVVETVVEGLERLLIDNDVQLNVGRVCEAVAEVVDNFAQHAGQRLAAMMVQYFPHHHMLSVAIGDCGVGIRGSLASNPNHAHLANAAHYQALLEAFKPLVSRRTEGAQGSMI